VRRGQVTSAVMVYVLVLLSLQIFLLSVAVEGFMADDPGLAWSATAISAILAISAALFYRFLRHRS